MATDTEHCCGGTCIEADLECCQTDPYGVWCLSPTGVCEPCPAGQTCYATNIDTGELFVSSWTCCDNDVCSFILSSGTLVSTISAASSQPSSAPTSSQSAAAPPSSTERCSPIVLSGEPGACEYRNILCTDYIHPTSFFDESQPPRLLLPRRIQLGHQTSFGVSLVTSSNTAIFFTSTSSTHSSIPPWNGAGPLLVGYCATPEFSLVYGPQTTAVYFIGVVGCVGEKPDCCPFQVSSTTSTVTETVTQTLGAGLTTTVTQIAGAGPPVINQFPLPAAVSSSQITLSRCPEDYETVSSVCCPS